MINFGFAGTSNSSGVSFRDLTLFVRQ